MFKSMFSRDIAIIGAGHSYGQRKRGTEDAYAWLKLKGLMDQFDSRVRPIDQGEILSLAFIDADTEFKQKFPHTIHQFPSVARFNQRLKSYVIQQHDLHYFPLVIGGDHSLAMGSIAGSLQVDPNLKVIWIDAHADFNTPETSPSGNLHGMPLSFLTNYYKHPLTKDHLHWLNYLDPKNIALIGIRDIDEGELKILDEVGVTCFPMKRVKEIGLTEALRLAMLKLDPRNRNNFHLSFDVDGIDSSIIPSTGTPVSDGLSLEDGKEVIRTMVETQRLISMDLVEFNPQLGDKDELLQSADAVFELVRELNAIGDFVQERPELRV
jgi:arginase